MMASLTASTDVMKKLSLRRQTQTMQLKIGFDRSMNHVQIKQLQILNITMVKTGENALEINQINVSTLDVSLS